LVVLSNCREQTTKKGQEDWNRKQGQGFTTCVDNTEHCSV